MKFILRIFLFGFFFAVVITPHNAHAASIRSGENITISEDEKDASDLYLFGGSVRVDAPVTNDVVAAGGDISINKAVSGSVIVAGGNIDILGSVGNTLRVAGGDILIDGPVTRDIVIAGGSVRVTKKASVSGDLVFNGGKLSLLAPVQGKVIINGGEVLIDSRVNGNVNGNVESLTLGKNAVINGDLRYKSEKQAITSDTAVIKGENVFQKIDRSEDRGRTVGELVKAGTYYKLFADILFSLLFVILLPLFLQQTVNTIRSSPLRSGVIGIIALLSIPVISLFLLLIVWLGIFAFLAYFMILIFAMVIANIFAGHLVLSWFYGRQNKTYTLDLKAAVVGPVVLYILWLIPLVGWLVAFVFYLLALGGVVRQVYILSLSQKKNKEV